MADQSSNNNAESFQSPGQILRAHREEMNLSQQDIANRIHLDIKIVDSIEKDSNDDMPAAIYIKGYLRSYAKIVNADADQIINIYNSDSPHQPPEILPEVKPPTQVSSSDKPVKAFTYLITLGLVLLLFIWFQSKYVVETSNNNEPENYNTETRINGVDTSYDVIEHSNSWETPANITDEKTELESESQLSTKDDSLELQTDNDEQTLGINSIDTMSETSTTNNIGTGPDTIELNLSKDSWIEIQDTNGKILFHDLALGGKNYSIHGKAPFKILFGFSAGVSIKFNGKPFDHSRYSTDGIARFRLPE